MEETLADAVLEDSRDKMAKAVNHTQTEFSTIRTGRAAPAPCAELEALDAGGSCGAATTVA